MGLRRRLRRPAGGQRGPPRSRRRRSRRASRAASSASATATTGSPSRRSSPPPVPAARRPPKTARRSRSTLRSAGGGDPAPRRRGPRSRPSPRRAGARRAHGPPRPVESLAGPDHRARQPGGGASSCDARRTTSPPSRCWRASRTNGSPCRRACPSTPRSSAATPLTAGWQAGMLDSRGDARRRPDAAGPAPERPRVRLARRGARPHPLPDPHGPSRPAGEEPLLAPTTRTSPARSCT